MSLLLTLGLVLAPQDGGTALPDIPLPSGIWQAWLDSPGGDLDFVLELRTEGKRQRAWLINDGDRTPASSVFVAGDVVEIAWADLDGMLRAKLGAGGTALDGTWEKQGASAIQLGFHARFGAEAIRPPVLPPGALQDPQAKTRAPEPCRGRYALQFADDKQPAVALLDESGGRVRGTIVTVLGDCRYLTGWRSGHDLVLSGFDGTRARLLRARVEGDSLHGQLWSDAQAAQAFTARRDDAATLPDRHGLTRARSERLGDLQFDDLTGRAQRLADPELRGSACVLLIFGSWSGNCHDATRTLVQLHERLGSRGMRVVGIACELTDDVERSRRVLSAYAKRHGVTWPILLAGSVQRASQAFPFLDRIVAYPTAVFVDGDGVVRGVCTGFVGPAAGKDHQDLVADWRARIEQMLQ